MDGFRAQLLLASQLLQLVEVAWCVLALTNITYLRSPPSDPPSHGDVASLILLAIGGLVSVIWMGRARACTAGHIVGRGICLLTIETLITVAAGFDLALRDDNLDLPARYWLRMATLFSALNTAFFGAILATLSDDVLSLAQ
jgi:hypothetical protein